MSQHLHVKLALHWIEKDDYDAKVTTTLLDTCYKFKEIRHGLPTGMLGIPEFAYVTVEYTRETGVLCGQIVREDAHSIKPVHSAGKWGAHAFVVVNGEVVGGDSAGFPRG